MKFSEQVKLAKSTKQIHSTWYRETYPEVAELGLDPATHYLRYGAEMGRNPGKNFNTQFYLDTYPEVVQSGLNPLVHYALHGQQAGYVTRQTKPERPNFLKIRKLMLSMGLEDKALSMLREIFESDFDASIRARAGLEMALWYFRSKAEEGYRLAIDILEESIGFMPSIDLRRRLFMLQLICFYHLGDIEQGLKQYDEKALEGLTSPDGMLAIANLQKFPEAQISWINRSLTTYSISPIALLPDEGQPLYDRIFVREPLNSVENGPKVTVLIAAYEAASMIGTAIRSLQEQTWRNLEIIIIDDCSPSFDTIKVAETFAQRDPRIKVLRMNRNGGAYVARNRGLDEATGEYVTLHDADDWSHPNKIETQVRYMQDNPNIMGCTSEQVRCTDKLIIGKPRGGGLLVMFNTSSFLWRREPVHAALGYWDTVRFGADSEFIRRVQTVFGQDSVVNIPTGILSFQREAATSVTSDPVKGIDGSGVFYGVRKEYREAQDYRHKTASSLHYSKNPDSRPFPVPPMMTLAGEEGYDRCFDVVIYGDFRNDNPEINEIVEKIDLLRAQGQTIALVEQNDDERDGEMIGHLIRSRIASGDVEISVYGERLKATKILHFGIDRKRRYAPYVELTCEVLE